VEPFADDQAAGVDNDCTHAWVGVTERSARCQLERTTHQRGIMLALWRADFTVGHVLPLILGSNFGRAPGRER
jgi:hypothetical protein